MLVIHTSDSRTRFLNVLYKTRNDIESIVNEFTNEIDIINLIKRSESIMLIGKGSEFGLFKPHDDLSNGGIFIGPHIAQFLRRKFIIGVWNESRLYAQRHYLTGIFMDTLLFDSQDLMEEGVLCNLMDIVDGRERWARDLSEVLKGNPLYAAEKMMEQEPRFPVDIFNYAAVVYLENGIPVQEE